MGAEKEINGGVLIHCKEESMLNKKNKKKKVYDE